MKKHKFTWVDGLVLAVILLLVIGTCVKFFVNDTTAVTRETVPFTYTLKIANIRDYTTDSLQVGDTVYDNEGKGAVGVISDIQIEPATTTLTASDGTISRVEIEDRYDVTLTLTAEGTPANGVYKVGTYDIRTNYSGLFFTKYSIWGATIISID